MQIILWFHSPDLTFIDPVEYHDLFKVSIRISDNIDWQAFDTEISHLHEWLLRSPPNLYAHTTAHIKDESTYIPPNFGPACALLRWINCDRRDGLLWNPVDMLYGSHAGLLN